jgi:hypothetical protein
LYTSSIPQMSNALIMIAPELDCIHFSIAEEPPSVRH